MSEKSLLDDLKDEIEAGRALLLVGAGVAIASTGRAPVASWPGLLRDGVERVATLGWTQSERWVERQLEILDEVEAGTADTGDLLSVAEQVENRLGAPNGPEWGRWLDETVGELPLVDPAILKALADLALPIATTNYDGLIERVTGFEVVTWRQSERALRVLRNEVRDVLHLHGFWQDPESVVLGIRSYEAVRQHELAQALQRILPALKSVVFVGCGAGLADPNFAALRQWMRTNLPTRHRHFRLCLESEVESLKREHPADERIFPISYGAKHEELEPFLLRLRGKSAATPVARPPSVPFSPPVVDVRTFVGRGSALFRLRHALVDQRGDGVAGIWGGPGFGKSALAARFAWRYRDRFPDGVLAVDWRAYKSAQAIAEVFADRIGEPIEPERSGRMSAWEIIQNRFGRRRCLLIVDNADQGDLSELVPQEGSSLLVTSRDRALLISLGVPPHALVEATPLRRSEEVALLARLVGKESVRAEQDATDALLEIGRGHALALRLAALCIVTSLGAAPIAIYVGRLTEAWDHLLAIFLPESEVSADLRAVFELSLELLTEPQKLTFTSLAVCPASGFGRNLARAVAGPEASLATVATDLLRLFNLGLLEHELAADRFRFDPLLRAYASEIGRARNLWNPAYERFTEHIAHFVRARGEVRPENVRELREEQEAVLEVAEHRARNALFDFGFLTGLNVLIDQTGQWRRGVELSEIALADPEWLDDRVGSALYLQRGKHQQQLGELREALADFDRSLDLKENLGDEHGLAMVLNSRGGVKRDLGDLAGAVADLERVRDFGAETLSVWGFSSLPDRLKRLRKVHNRLGRTVEQAKRDGILARFYFELAKGYLVNEKDPIRPIWLLHRVLELDHARQHRAGTLFTLGKCYFRLRQHEEAVHFLNEAFAAGFESSELRGSLAYAMTQTGVPLAETRVEYEAAIQDTTNAWARSWYALALSAEGQHEEAEAMSRSALAVVGQAENSSLLCNLAHVLLATKDGNKREAAVDVLHLAARHAPSGFDWPQRLLTEVGELT